MPLRVTDHHDTMVLRPARYGMGSHHAGTNIGTTVDDCTVEFFRSWVGHQGRRTVMEFGPHIPPDTFDQPGIDNAVSTLMVRGTPGGQVLNWLRKVRVITLAEVFEYVQQNVSWHFLYKAWMEGECVMGPRPKRGVPGGGHGKRPREYTKTWR